VTYLRALSVGAVRLARSTSIYRSLFLFTQNRRLALVGRRVYVTPVRTSTPTVCRTMVQCHPTRWRAGGGGVFTTYAPFPHTLPQHLRQPPSLPLPGLFFAGIAIPAGGVLAVPTGANTALPPPPCFAFWYASVSYVMSVVADQSAIHDHMGEHLCHFTAYRGL